MSIQYNDWNVVRQNADTLELQMTQKCMGCFFMAFPLFFGTIIAGILGKDMLKIEKLLVCFPINLIFLGIIIFFLASLSIFFKKYTINIDFPGRTICSRRKGLFGGPEEKFFIENVKAVRCGIEQRRPAGRAGGGFYQWVSDIVFSDGRSLRIRGEGGMPFIIWEDTREEELKKRSQGIAALLNVPYLDETDKVVSVSSTVNPWGE